MYIQPTDNVTYFCIDSFRYGGNSKLQCRARLDLDFPLWRSTTVQMKYIARLYFSFVKSSILFSWSYSTKYHNNFTNAIYQVELHILFRGKTSI